jgi:hypothetical protein
VKRAVTVAAALLAVAVAIVLLRPRPALDLRIGADGIAEVHDRFGRTRTLPETLVVRAAGRPRIRIVNADTVTHRLGLFSAPPGETVEYTLPQPGTYTGACSAHPTSRTLTYVVR